MDGRERFGAARVARLATTTSAGDPHLVPIVFVLLGDTVWSAVDAKPKSTRALRRLDNIRTNPRVSMLVDHYDDDWSTLWWVRADGDASVQPANATASPQALAALAALAAKYAHYQGHPPPGPLVRLDVATWTQWSAADYTEAH